MAAVTAAKLSQMLQSEMGYPISCHKFWTDSKTLQRFKTTRGICCQQDPENPWHLRTSPVGSCPNWPEPCGPCITRLCCAGTLWVLHVAKWPLIPMEPVSSSSSTLRRLPAWEPCRLIANGGEHHQPFRHCPPKKGRRNQCPLVLDKAVLLVQDETHHRDLPICQGNLHEGALPGWVDPGTHSASRRNDYPDCSTCSLCSGDKGSLSIEEAEYEE